MKREEMLKIMLESYCQEVPYHNDGGVQLTWKLIRLLEDMLEAGMLPPLNKPLFYKASESMQDIERHYTTQYHIWED